MKRVFTVAEPKLDWGTMAEVHPLVWLGMLSILSKVMLGALRVSPLPVTVVMLQLNIFGMEMFIFLRHLSDAGTEELYLCLEVGIY
ncbi:unnamed protein product [Prunus armeniaca]